MKDQKMKSTDADVRSRDGESWFYSDIVKDHFFNPRNFASQDPKPEEFNAIGRVGSPACGDELKVWLWVDPASEKIKSFKWKTFGCGSAIAATSVTSEIVTENGGLTLTAARQLKPQDIIERLGGLPNRKIHCSVLCDKALREAINDYYRRSGQIKKIQDEGARIIDPITKITDKDIEQAVLSGAVTLEQVQQKTKVGLGAPEIIPAVEELIKFYREKYQISNP